jgi:hypothetical protein
MMVWPWNGSKNFYNIGPLIYIKKLFIFATSKRAEILANSRLERLAVGKHFSLFAPLRNIWQYQQHFVYSLSNKWAQ